MKISSMKIQSMKISSMSIFSVKIPACLAVCLAVLLAFPQSQALANQVESDPHAVVEAVTEKLLGDISSYRKALDRASDRSERDAHMASFFGQLESTLEPVVDFQWIALNVMGSQRQQATAEQQERFRAVFSRALVETYGRGLLSYSGQDIVVLPSTESVTDQRRVTVRQEIRGADSRVPLLYSMSVNRDGDWKVVNVIINGINLGTTFRNQFAQSYASYGGNIDKVIDNWAVQNPDT